MGFLGDVVGGLMGGPGGAALGIGSSLLGAALGGRGPKTQSISPGANAKCLWTHVWHRTRFDGPY
jgi:hypothetical protein